MPPLGIHCSSSAALLGEGPRRTPGPVPPARRRITATYQALRRATAGGKYPPPPPPENLPHRARTPNGTRIPCARVVGWWLGQIQHGDIGHTRHTLLAAHVCQPRLHALHAHEQQTGNDARTMCDTVCACASTLARAALANSTRRPLTNTTIGQCACPYTNAQRTGITNNHMRRNAHASTTPGHAEVNVHRNPPAANPPLNRNCIPRARMPSTCQHASASAPR